VRLRFSRFLSGFVEKFVLRKDNLKRLCFVCVYIYIYILSFEAFDAVMD
jgi:hypothetical protein